MRRVKGACTQTSHIYTHPKDTLSLFCKGWLLQFEQWFPLLEAMGKNKMKTEHIKIHGRSHENYSQRLETAASKRSKAEDFAVRESTLRKRLKTETAPTSLDRFQAIFQMRKRNNRLICRDSEDRFFGMKTWHLSMLRRKVLMTDLT